MEICHQRGHDAVVADAMALPYQVRRMGESSVDVCQCCADPGVVFHCCSRIDLIQ